MAIEDIDLMTEEEMDIGSDPEMQDILKQLGAGEAQALMQLIKEYKEMVAKGFQGEFEDFVKIKMATAQGEDEFQSEDEMIIEPDEMMDIQKQIVPTEMAANGGRIGYRKGGGPDWINTHEPGPMGNPAVMEEVEDMREFMIANPDIEDVADYKGYYERLKKKRKKKQVGGIMDVVEDEEVVETTPGPTRQQMIMDYLRERGLPITPENIQKAIIEMITGGIPYTEEAAYEMPQMDQPSVLPRGMMIDESMMQQTPSGIASVNVMEDIVPEPRPYLYDAPVKKEPWDTQQSTMFAAQGGKARKMPKSGFPYKPLNYHDLTEKLLGVAPQSDEYNPINEIYMKFKEKFPTIDTDNMTIEDMLAELQMEGVEETPGAGIFDIYEGSKMITPESIRGSMPGVMRGMAQGGRVPYGLGSLVKKIFKPIKKVGKGLVKSVKKFAKSDLGKAALMYMATAGMANIGAAGGLKGASWSGGQWLKPTNVLSNLGSSWGNVKEMFTPAAEASKASSALTSGNISPQLSNAIVGDASLAGKSKNILNWAGKTTGKEGIMSRLATSFKNNPMPWILGSSLAGAAYTAANPGEQNLDRLMADRNREVADWDNIMANIRSGQTVTPFATDNVMFPYPNYYQNVAEGGRIGRAEGGIMDLGGMEKDYRETGGFVPIGEYEKKDDVPARLSLNEFVMTADAVRGAGNGDVDKGAEVMEDMMETLEQQGQRHRQAQDMFSVSERLSEVVN